MAAVRRKLRQVATEHSAIRATVIQIRVELDRLLLRPARTKEEWTLPFLVRALRASLFRHFEREESGALFESVRDGQAGEAGTSERLAEDHRALERLMDQVLTGLDAGIVPSPLVQGCYDRELRKLLDVLDRHECVEGELLDELSR